VVAELYLNASGLGLLIQQYGNTFRMAPYFVVVLTLATIGIAVTTVLRALERRLATWRGDAR
jgi:NitT/TauT family transport system permease protein